MTSLASALVFTVFGIGQRRRSFLSWTHGPALCPVRKEATGQSCHGLPRSPSHFGPHSGVSAEVFMCVQFVLDGTPRMRERPIKDLVDGLKQLDVDVTCSDTGCPPVRDTSPPH